MRNLGYGAIAFVLAVIAAIFLPPFFSTSKSVVDASDSNKRPSFPKYAPNTPCGVAASYVAWRLLSPTADLEEVRSRIKPDPYGRNTLTDIEFGLNDLGLSTAAVQMTSFSLQRAGCPAILHLSEGHFIVCAGYKGSHSILVDPPKPVSLKKMSEFESWTGVALLVTSTEPELSRALERLGL